MYSMDFDLAVFNLFPFFLLLLSFWADSLTSIQVNCSDIKLKLLNEVCIGTYHIRRWMYYVLYSVQLGNLSFSCLTIMAYFPGFKVVYKFSGPEEQKPMKYRVKSMISLFSFPVSLNNHLWDIPYPWSICIWIGLPRSHIFAPFAVVSFCQSPSYINKEGISALKLTMMPLSLAESVNGQIFGPNLPSEESHIIADNRIHPIWHDQKRPAFYRSVFQIDHPIFQNGRMVFEMKTIDGYYSTATEASEIIRAHLI